MKSKSARQMQMTTEFSLIHPKKLSFHPNPLLTHPYLNQTTQNKQTNIELENLDTHFLNPINIYIHQYPNFDELE